MVQRLGISVLVVFACALVGLSLSAVAGSEALLPTLGGAIIGTIAAVVGFLAKDGTAQFEQSRGPQLVGMRVSTVGLCVAALGWVVSVFSSSRFGYVVAAIGIAIGLVGLVLHAARFVRK